MAYITVGGSKLGATPSSAKSLPYDNTSSELTATSVQAAIDELANPDSANDITTFEEASAMDNISSGETHATLFGKIKKWLSSLASVAFSGSYNDLGDTPSLATVATSGSYTDLINKPTIPTVNNATLTIQKNGSNVSTFTANASSNVTCNITVPTNNNQLTNGAGYITSSGSCAYASTAGQAPRIKDDSHDYTATQLWSTLVGLDNSREWNYLGMIYGVTTITIPDISNAKEIMFLLVYNNSQVYDCKIVPKSYWISGREIVLSFTDSDRAWVVYVSDTKVSTNTWCSQGYMGCVMFAR